MFVVNYFTEKLNLEIKTQQFVTESNSEILLQQNVIFHFNKCHLKNVRIKTGFTRY